MRAFCTFFLPSTDDARPVNLTTHLVTDTQILLTWELPTIAIQDGVIVANYTIEHEVGGSGVRRMDTTQDPIFLLDGLTPAWPHEFEVSVDYATPQFSSSATNGSQLTESSGTYYT